MEAKLDAPAKHPEFDADFRERLQALLAWRRDVRRFRREALPPGTIERLIGIACLSPSVGLSEPWRFVIVDDQTPPRGDPRLLRSCAIRMRSSGRSRTAPRSMRG